ncbi:hypothetical protein D043_3781A, partial [Vibrio parahaemolyticus EKP-021]
MGSHKAVVFV